MVFDSEDVVVDPQLCGGASATRMDIYTQPGDFTSCDERFGTPMPAVMPGASGNALYSIMK